jgi:general stress protein YciG
MDTSDTTTNDATATTGGTETAVPTKKRRGFAAMDPAQVREIASKGGKAAHKAGTAHRFTSEEAAAAGSKGGRASHAKRSGAG